MIKNRIILYLTIIFICIGRPAEAVQLGDPAPEINISEWVKGEKVNFETGKGKNIYVLVFWATWCEPCQECIPHLSEMQKKFKAKDVVMIALSTEESEDVKGFVKEKGEDIAYTVAIDSKDDRTFRNYMEAFAMDDIPYSFVTDRQGKIVWHGHPLEGLEDTLEEIISGKFDLEKAKIQISRKIETDKAERLIPVYRHLCLNTDEIGLIKAVANRILYHAKGDAEFLNTFAQLILNTEEINRYEGETALKAVQSAVDLTKGENASILSTYSLALFESGQLKEAIEYQKKAVALCKDEKEKAEYKERLEDYQNYLNEE